MPDKIDFGIEILDFGIKEYGKVLSLQKNLFNNLVESKKEGQTGKEFILIGEHYPVITLGRRANENNVLISPQILLNQGVELFHVGRGGDVTFHCPGQMVVYPILDLEKHGLGVKDYVNILEESIIQLLEKYGINGERIEGATGVWIGKGTAHERKICAIGIKCSRFCTMHGLALNVTNDIAGFSMINPCGFVNKGVTSLVIESEKKMNEKLIENSQEPKESTQKLFVIPEKVKKDFLDIFLRLIFSF